MTHTQKTIDSLANGVSRALYHEHHRRKAAAEVRHLLSVRRLARDNCMSQLVDRINADISVVLFKAPEPLNTRERIVRHARNLHTWAIHTRKNAGWDAMWCGEQDALGERLDDAHATAHDLITLARYRKARGEW